LRDLAGSAEETCDRAAASPARLPLSDTGSAAASDVVAALMLATSEGPASTGRPEVGAERVGHAFRAQTGTVVATPRCPSELTSTFALLSFREFENARPVIVDRAGYRELDKQAIGRYLHHLTARVEQQSRGGRSWPRYPGRTDARRRRIAFTICRA
jgi:hypothetical protein